MGRIANIGHNEPCHCGSSKKYKNCCLAKDEAAARAKAMADARAAETARQAARPLDDVAPESEEPREPGLAPLPPNEHRLVNDWWEEVGPVYTGKGGKDKCGWLLERGWNDDEKKKLSGPFGLNEKRLDRYLAQRCRIFFYLKGVRAVSTVQAFHYFTQYLVAHDYFSAAEAGRLQSAAKGLFETIRGAVDICDPAYRLCPTYAALIAGAEAAPTLPPVALATMSKAD